MKETYMLFFARFFIASMFFISASIKIFTFDSQIILISNPDNYILKIYVIISIAVELFFSLMLLIDYKTKLAIIILTIFLLGNTIMIPYKFPDLFQVTIYKKNLAILGGMIALFLMNLKKPNRGNNET